MTTPTLWDRLTGRPRRRLVRVHHTNMDGSIEGVFESLTPEHYVLSRARLVVSAQAKPQPVGDVWIPRASVAFVQDIAPAAESL